MRTPEEYNDVKDLPFEAQNSQSSPHIDQSERSHSLELLAQVTTLAWNLMLPIVGGVLLGNYLDQRKEGGITWTLSLLVLGVMIAFSNLYNLYMEHGHEVENPSSKEKRVSEETHE